MHSSRGWLFLTLQEQFIVVECFLRDMTILCIFFKCYHIELQNSFCTGVTETSVSSAVMGPVCFRSRCWISGGTWFVGVLQFEVWRLLAVWVQMDSNLGQGLMWCPQWSRVCRGKACLGVNRWRGAGDLQVQSDAGNSGGGTFIYSSFSTHSYLKAESRATVLKPSSLQLF